jgi:hypothetical protein
MEPTSPEPKNEGVSHAMHEQHHCCCRSCRRGGWFVRLLRVIVWLIVLGLVLSIAASFFIFGIFSHHMGSYSVRGIPVKNGFMMQWHSTSEDDVQLFGIITKISGAAITIIDNGNVLRTVLSSANTGIYDVDAELSIKDLKVGDRIIATGTLLDRTLTATTIEISSHAK